MEKRVHKLTFYHPKLEKIWDCFNEAYLVGGFVRDRLLRVRKEKVDIDLTVKGLTEKEVKCVEERLKGRAYSIKKDKEVFSLVTQGERIDISPLQGRTIEEDLRKRDFTINAIGVNLSELFLPFNDDALLVDPTGGYEDLVRGLIRPTGEEALKEDPLRVLRGIRFKHTLDFEYSGLFEKLAPIYGKELGKVASERVGEELRKVEERELLYETVRDLLRFNGFFQVFKELKGIERIPKGGLHQFDLLEHSLRTLFFMEKFALKEAKTILKEFWEEPLRDKGCLKLIALYHDVGKPLTAEERGGRLSFYGHDKVGAPIAQRALLRLGFGKQCSRVAYCAVRNHLRPFFLYELFKKGELSERAIYRFFRDSKGCSFHTLLLSVADFMATSQEMERRVNEYLDFIQYLLGFYRERLKELKPLLTGREIMEIKGFKEPNRWVGRIKEKLLELQALRKVNTKEEAISFVKGFTVGEEG